jgi:hypothetical protein
VDGYSVDFGGHSHHLPDDQNIKEESHWLYFYSELYVKPRTIEVPEEILYLLWPRPDH